MVPIMLNHIYKDYSNQLDQFDRGFRIDFVPGYGELIEWRHI